MKIISSSSFSIFVLLTLSILVSNVSFSAKKGDFPHEKPSKPVDKKTQLDVLSVNQINESPIESMSPEEFEIEKKRILIKFKDSFPGEKGLTKSMEKRIINETRKEGVDYEFSKDLQRGWKLITIKGNGVTLDKLKKIASNMEKNKWVEYAEADIPLYPTFTPNDTYYNLQWNLQNTVGGVKLPDAWDLSLGAGTVIGIVDTGYTSHSDLNSKTLPGYDFISDVYRSRDGNGRDNNPTDMGDWDTNPLQDCPYFSSSTWHGTHVAGIAGMLTNNSNWFAGVSPNSDIFHARVLGRCGGSPVDIADAIEWSSGGSIIGIPNNANPADVINVSLGGQGSCSQYTQEAINMAVNNGATVVVSAGNEGYAASNNQPANCNNVITVAATDENKNRASFSNYGSTVDVAAPGTHTTNSGIYSTSNDGVTSQGNEGWRLVGGTSQAAPHVTGIAALIKSIDSNLSPSNIESIIKNTTDAVNSCPGGCGSGLVNAFKAVEEASSACPVGYTKHEGFLSNGSNAIEPNGSYYYKNYCELTAS